MVTGLLLRLGWYCERDAEVSDGSCWKNSGVIKISCCLCGADAPENGSLEINWGEMWSLGKMTMNYKCRSEHIKYINTYTTKKKIFFLKKGDFFKLEMYRNWSSASNMFSPRNSPRTHREGSELVEKGRFQTSCRQWSTKDRKHGLGYP